MATRHEYKKEDGTVNVSWEGRCTVDGEEKRKRGFETKELALQWAESLPGSSIAKKKRKEMEMMELVKNNKRRKLKNNHGCEAKGVEIFYRKIEEQYKKRKKNKDEVPIKDFRQECREFAKSWIQIHIKEFKRLGVVGDFENYYSTMSFEAEAQIVRELGKFLLDGSLYQGFKPVLWSTVEKTALADAEVEYKDHTSNTIFVAFKIKDTKKEFLKNANIIIMAGIERTIENNILKKYVVPFIVPEN